MAVFKCKMCGGDLPNIAEGNVVEWSESKFRGDRFRFMSRQQLDWRDAPPAGEVDTAPDPIAG